MAMILRILMACVAAFALSSCGQSQVENYQVINKDSEGRISVLNQKTGRLIVINKSNRIDDVTDLDIKDAEVVAIKKTKEQQDGLLKIRSWGEHKIANSPYSVLLSTRHYKDKLLFSLIFSKADDSTPRKARTISINLRDKNGFVLERITPTSWITVVDEEGKPQYEQSSGEISMTLDNYLEVSNYDPNWAFH